MTPEKLALKIAFKDTVKGAGGYAAAELLLPDRVKRSRLQEYSSLDDKHAKSFAPIDVVAGLEPLAKARDGWPRVTRTLCTLMGGTFVMLPRGEITRVDLLGSVGRLAKEHGDIAEKLCAALADGVVGPHEVPGIRAEIGEAQALLALLDAQMVAIAEGGQ